MSKKRKLTEAFIVWLFKYSQSMAFQLHTKLTATFLNLFQVWNWTHIDLHYELLALRTMLTSSYWQHCIIPANKNGEYSFFLDSNVFGILSGNFSKSGSSRAKVSCKYTSNVPSVFCCCLSDIAVKYPRLYFKFILRDVLILSKPLISWFRQPK